jgi:TonB-dependent starch-binding outer membrane protein SusC
MIFFFIFTYLITIYLIINLKPMILNLTKQLNQRNFIRSSIMLVILLMFQMVVFGQMRQINGTVTDASGESLPGVNVLIKGTTTGTITDFDGKYSIPVKNETDVLVFSFVGYLEQIITVGRQSQINVSLKEDVLQLNEVVAIGYGVQKKKLNTGSTLNVKGDDIEKLNTSRPIEALQGLSPGVSIVQSNGLPGSEVKVYIRGIGTTGNSKPTYIIDGVAVGNIDNLSPSDIESIDVLKDAASAAIYGSRAANGVILITTKKGSKGQKPVVSYDFYNGWQSVYKDPGLLNAQEYRDIMIESNANSGGKPLDFKGTVPNWDKIESGEWTGTNWFKEMLTENAQVQNHSLSIAGGSDRTIYSMGFGYYNEVGILGPQGNNVYNRITARMNSEHIIIQSNKRNILKVGENMTYTHTQNPTFRTGNIYWNDLHNALVANPFLPMYAENETDAAYPYHYAIAWNSADVNPIALLVYNSKDNHNSNNSLIGNVYAELEPIKDLKIKSSYGVNASFGSSRQWTPPYELSTRTIAPLDKVFQSMYENFTWTLTNTATYNKSFGNHNISAVVGNEMLRTSVKLTLSGTNYNSLFGDAEHAYLFNVPEVDATLTQLTGKDEYGESLMSYFGRVSYDYKETYMLTMVLRADGSSNFAEGHRWGTFPSFSAGWVISNEPFMKDLSAINFLKLRGSWGQNGNKDIDKFQYLSSLSYTNAIYYFGPDKRVQSVGAYPARVPNPNVSWETSEQISAGFDLYLFNNKLQTNFDWYRKNTRDWLVKAPALATNGTAAPFINGGDIRNEGIELAINWNDKVGDFKYGVNASVAHNKNKITNIANDEKIIHGQANVLSQGTSEMYRAEVGYPIGYFWGFQTDGVMQNEAEVAAYVKPNGDPYFKGMLPGDLRFVDQNKDGLIDDSDKVMLGDPNPDLIFGLQFNAEYKGFSILINTNGKAGMQVAKSYRSFADGPRQNYTTDVFNRWHGEGTSDKYPRLTAKTHRNMTNISDIYIEDADFVKISNITIGYDFKQILKKFPIEQLRLYFSAKNILTFTKYSGMDPEVGYGPDGWSSGIDLGLYPSSKSYMIGINVKF